MAFAGVFDPALAAAGLFDPAVSGVGLFDDDFVGGTSAGVTASSTAAVPFGASAAVTLLVQESTSAAMPVGGNATATALAQASASEALPIGGSATGAVSIQASSSNALPIGGSAAGTALVQTSSTAALPIGGSAQFALVPLSVPPYQMTIPMRPTAGGLVIGKPFQLDTSQPAVIITIRTADSTRPFPLSGTANATVLVQSASSSAMPLGGASAGIVADLARSDTAFPIGGSASASALVQPTSSAPLPIASSVSATVDVRSDSTQPMPIGGSATTLLGDLITGTSSQPVPIGGSATATISLQANSTVAVPIGFLNAIIGVVRGDSTQRVGIAGDAMGFITDRVIKPIVGSTFALAVSVETFATQLDSNGVPMQTRILRFTQFETGPVVIQITDADGNVIDISTLTSPKLNVRKRHGTTYVVDHVPVAPPTSLGFIWDRQSAEVALFGDYLLQLQGLQDGQFVELPTGGMRVRIEPAVSNPA